MRGEIPNTKSQIPNSFAKRNHIGHWKLVIGHSARNTVKYGVWPTPVSLVATKGISLDFFSTATEIFQFTVYPPTALYIQAEVLAPHYVRRSKEVKK